MVWKKFGPKNLRGTKSVQKSINLLLITQLASNAFQLVIKVSYVSYQHLSVSVNEKDLLAATKDLRKVDAFCRLCTGGGNINLSPPSPINMMAGGFPSQFLVRIIFQLRAHCCWVERNYWKFPNYWDIGHRNWCKSVNHFQWNQNSNPGQRLNTNKAKKRKGWTEETSIRGLQRSYFW